VFGWSCSDGNAVKIHTLVWSERLGMGVATAIQPPCNCRRREQGNIVRESIQASERQVVRMSVRQQECMNDREIRDRDPRSPHSWKETPESGTEVRVRKQTNTCKVEQEGRMPYIGNAKLR
jgi:hypothetical protein